MAYWGVSVEGKGAEKLRGRIYSVNAENGARTEIVQSEQLFRSIPAVSHWAHETAAKRGMRLQGGCINKVDRVIRSPQINVFESG
jgi:hypothetical protein